MRLLTAHVELAKAELSAIGGEIAKVAAFAGVAFLAAVFVVFLLTIGISLFLAEWILGSMGWGVLHGTLLAIGVGTACILAAVGVSGRRLGRDLVIGVVVGVLASIVFGLALPNQLYDAIGDAVAPAWDPAYRPLLVGIIVGLAVGLIVGLILAFGAMRSGGGRVTAVLGATVLGGLLGAFTAISFHPQIGVGIGITIGYLAWIAAMAIDIYRTGVDVEALKARFTPTQTIDTSKETLEWLKSRMPGSGS